MKARTVLAVAVVAAHAQGLLAVDPVVREREGSVMGTYYRIVAAGEDTGDLDKAIEAAVTEMRRVEDLMTDWRPSPLTRLNENAGSPYPVPRELAAIISRSLALCELTDGAFDPTFASAGKLWDFKRKPPHIPSDEDIRTALESVGGLRVKVDAEKNTVTLPEGSRLGLGGIAKGYGIDRAMRVLREHGIRNAMVDAGGDMKVLGSRAGKPWEIALKHPRNRERAMAVLHLSNVSVVTSGDYERFFMHEGKRYHHILDPRTGRPATGCMSATVVAPNAEFADALATALCVMAPTNGLQLVEGLKRVDTVLVDMEGAVHVSSGLKGRVDSTPR